MDAKEFALKMIEKSHDLYKKKIAVIRVAYNPYFSEENDEIYYHEIVSVHIYLGGYENANDRNAENEFQWDYSVDGTIEDGDYEAEMKKIDDLIVNWIGG